MRFPLTIGTIVGHLFSGPAYAKTEKTTTDIVLLLPCSRCVFWTNFHGTKSLGSQHKEIEIRGPR